MLKLLFRFLLPHTSSIHWISLKLTAPISTEGKHKLSQKKKNTRSIPNSHLMNFATVKKTKKTVLDVVLTSNQTWSSRVESRGVQLHFFFCLWT